METTHPFGIKHGLWIWTKRKWTGRQNHRLTDSCQEWSGQVVTFPRLTSKVLKKFHAVLKAKLLCSAGCHHRTKGSLNKKASSNHSNNCNWSRNLTLTWSNDGFKNIRIKDIGHPLHLLQWFLFQICLNTDFKFNVQCVAVVTKKTWKTPFNSVDNLSTSNNLSGLYLKNLSLTSFA